MITIAQERCTGCEVCTSVCPDRALTRRMENGRLVIAIDYSKCSPCGECQPLCPEQALRVAEGPGAPEGLVTLFECDLAQCDACGRYFAPQPLIDKFRAMLSRREPGVLATLGLCSACKEQSYSAFW